MINNNEGQIPFQESWAFPSEIKTLLGASWFETLDAPDKFASGRPKKLVRFLGEGFGPARAILGEREGMLLTSKKTGLPYVVCRRKETPPRAPRTQKPKPAGSPLDASMVLCDDDEVPPPVTILRREMSSK